MYNRYIPQPDGSFRRRRIEDRPTQQPSPVPPASPTPPCEEQPKPAKQTAQRCGHHRSCRSLPPAKKENGSVTGFLKRLLPKDFDTGDLFVVLLLLLMAGDCAEEQNTALLTLALYFFM